MEGDFGRPKRGVVLASIAEPIGMGTEPGWANDEGTEPSWSNDEGYSEPESDVGPTEPGSVLPLTAEEIQLREAAYRLRVQVQNLVPIGASVDTEIAYAEHLTRQGYLHGPSRLAKIEHEIRTDHDALTKFAHAARIVLGGDRVRMGAAFDRRTSLTGSDKHDAHARVGENMLVIRRTFADIERRIAAYDYAIDRTRVETPVLATGHAKSALNHLRDRTASLQYELMEAHQAAQRIARYGSKARPAPGGAAARGPVDIRPPAHRSGKRAVKPSK
ncbi:MAG: hypothetical protein ACR2PO_18735 [Methyloligellaceae bacterium]